MENSHILVVEDDVSLAQWICDYLIEKGFQVSHANAGDVAIELIQSDNPDLILLDIMLPKMNGFDVCKDARETKTTPILMMTASDDEVDEVLGLELGADDYITKPIKPRVLLARIKALLRRGIEKDAGDRKAIQYGELHIDSNNKTVVLHGETLKITPTEFDMLWLLASRAGEIVSRNEMVSQLRGLDYDGFDRSIDIKISRLRKKLGDDTSSSKRIKTIRGKGYLFAKDAWEPEPNARGSR